MKSRVCIFDLNTGAVDPVLTTDRHVEAPNWTPDGGALIVNGGGRLFRVALSAPSLEDMIDTGFAVTLNNDHGLSPDGQILAISDKTKFGQSCVYTVPVGGGEPKQITDEVPSYWHGWSPDGSMLAYAAKREETYQIFVCPAQGGEETQLTHDFDHCDGPDYAPDGRWIWFNGERQGSVQLWRIPSNGGEPEQMTNDERINWFPHPSPDGSTVLYLAYEPGVTGHPSNKTVQLRLMPSAGGEPRTLRELFGGQGTINVPCWAPDGRRFAFVEYEP